MHDGTCPTPPEWIPPTKLDWQHLIRRSENYDRDP